MTTGVAIGVLAALAVPLALVEAGPGDGSTPTEETVVEATTTTADETTTTIETTTTEATAPPSSDSTAPVTEPPTDTSPAPTSTESTDPPVTVGPAAPDDTYDVSVVAVCDPGYVPAIDIVNLGTGTIRVSVGSQSAVLAGGETWDLAWPTAGRDPADLDPAPKWDAVNVDASVVFESGVLSLPPDCPPSNVPGAPLDVVSTAGVEAVTLTWTAPADGGFPILDYTIEVNQYPAEDDVWIPYVDGVGIGTSVTVSGLTNGTTYLFRIQAINANGGGPSAEAKDTPQGVLASAPQSLVVTPTNQSGQLRATWLAPASDGGQPITDYVIERSPTGTSGWTTVVDGVNTNTAYTITGLTNGIRWYVRVRAVTAAGLSPYSKMASSVPRTVPTAPRSLTAAATGLPGQVQLAWLPPINTGGAPVVDYVLQRSPDGLGRWTTISDGVNVNRAYTVTGLATNVRYYFRVLAKNAAGTGPASNLAGAIPRYLLTAPRSLTATPTNRSGQVRLAWLAPLSNGGTRVVDYVIQRSPNGTTGWTTINDGINVNTAYTVTGLTNGVRTYFRVIARTTRATSAPSNVANAVPRTVPSAIRSLTAAPNNLSGQVRLAWLAPSSNGGAAITDYVIQRSPNGTTGWTTVADGISTSTTATVNGLTNGVRTYFRVFARNAAGASPASAVVSAIPRTVPSQPASFSVDADAEGYYFAWSAPSSTGGSPITGYIIQIYDPDTNSWESSSLLNPAWRSAFLAATGFGCDWFRIAAVNAAGIGRFTSPVEACYLP